jgi:hypothetical protein
LETDYELFNNKFILNKNNQPHFDLTVNNFLPYKRHKIISKRLNELVFDD